VPTPLLFPRAALQSHLAGSSWTQHMSVPMSLLACWAMLHAGRCTWALAAT
jgi:hypothetical protein